MLCNYDGPSNRSDHKIMMSEHRPIKKLVKKVRKSMLRIHNNSRIKRLFGDSEHAKSYLGWIWKAI